MASIRKHPLSKFWFACFKLPTGQRTQRSTKTTDRKLAIKLANSWEEAARGKLTEAQARRVIGDLYLMVSGDPLPSSSVREFFETWIQRKKVETSARTFEKYSDFARRFVTFLGERADADIAHLSSKQLADFRDSLLKKLSPTTANLALKIIRSALAHAKREGLTLDNVAERVKTLTVKSSEGGRRSFTLPELRAMLTHADAEWRGMIVLGLYTGQRLGDIATLTWQNLDLERNELRLVTGKTGRRQIIPLAAPVVRYVASMPASDCATQPLFPRAKAIVDRTGLVGALSGQFYNVMASAGLVETRTHRKKLSGRGAKRQLNSISFHALRHTATSLMKNAGVSPAIVQEFIGQDSPAMSANYTHIDMDAMRKAAESLPNILNER